MMTSADTEQCDPIGRSSKLETKTESPTGSPRFDDQELRQMGAERGKNNLYLQGGKKCKIKGKNHVVAQYSNFDER